MRRHGRRIGAWNWSTAREFPRIVRFERSLPRCTGDRWLRQYAAGTGSGANHAEGQSIRSRHPGVSEVSDRVFGQFARGQRSVLVGRGLLRQQVVSGGSGRFSAGSRQISSIAQASRCPAQDRLLPIRVETMGLGQGNSVASSQAVPRHTGRAFGAAAPRQDGDRETLIEMSRKPDRLRVNEIFHSLQGEADAVGYPTVFVRLTGCPLRCQYCDTEYAFHAGDWLDLEAIVEKVRSYGAQHA